MTEKWIVKLWTRLNRFMTLSTVNINLIWISWTSPHCYQFSREHIIGSYHSVLGSHRPVNFSYQLLLGFHGSVSSAPVILFSPLTDLSSVFSTHSSVRFSSSYSLQEGIAVHNGRRTRIFSTKDLEKLYVNSE